MVSHRKSGHETRYEDGTNTIAENKESKVQVTKDSLNAERSQAVSREELIGLLNEDLAREYQAIIAYVVYSQVLKGAEYMTIAEELETHAREELQPALIISKQIDYLGGRPTVTSLPVKTSEVAEEMLHFDLDNENETVRNYRERVHQCEALGEYAIAEHIREILVQEQELCGRVGGIFLKCLLEIPDRASRNRPADAENPAWRALRGGRSRRLRGSLVLTPAGAELQPKAVDDRARNLVLDRENVGELPIEPARP